MGVGRSEGRNAGKGKALYMGGRDEWMEKGREVLTDGRTDGLQGVINVKRNRRMMKRLKAKQEI